MNLSPAWEPLLRAQGFEVIHWSVLGAHNAPDTEIMKWARDNGCVLLTHDLDPGILLAHSKDGGALLTIDESKSRVRILPI